ncbi:hypothetical protein BJV78DRAFT_413399 [Lactifluus subvellereus]|nr:hypothetical protein BJV78DRAFT_413399 [Lactifluus subvellereus]
MWQSCKICRKSTARYKMSDGTYLSSFAKFLECCCICLQSVPFPARSAHTRPSLLTQHTASGIPIQHHTSLCIQVQWCLLHALSRRGCI